MIPKQHILELAKTFTLSPDVIEKDFVLGWILAGINNHPDLSENWVFKGGTCLKKCFFETYRFSEDLDFTLRDESHLEADFLTNAFSEITDWVYETSGVQISIEAPKFDVYKNPRGGLSCEGRIYYQGPIERKGSSPKIKLDLTSDELLVLDPVQSEVNHTYEDLPSSGIQILSYCFEEIFAEKVRALQERLRPRDLYDVINLHRIDNLNIDRGLLRDTLNQKCDFKGIPSTTWNIIKNSPYRNELESEWENMLGHQLPILPPFEEFWNELEGFFKWLHEMEEKPQLQKIQVREAIDHSWQPTHRHDWWQSKAPLEVIRFAASNRLCIDLDYTDAEGRSAKRLIEPYSLRKSQAGDILLCAIRNEDGQPRTYRMDRIQGVTVSQKSFIPSYEIELGSMNYFSAPEIERTSSPQSHRSRKRKTTNSYGPKYQFRCPGCGVARTRKSYDSYIKPHKRRGGGHCNGGYGTHIGTKY